MDSPFIDAAAESAVLAGIFRHGRDAFVDCEELIGAASFDDPTNQLIFACAADFFADSAAAAFDYASLISVAKRKGYGEIFEHPEEKKHVFALMKYPVALESVRREAAKLLKLRVGKGLFDEMAASAKKLRKITGDETMTFILGLAENPIFEYTARLNAESHDTKQIAEGIDAWLDAVIDNPRDNVGIPSPFPRYNRLIGGGFRRRSISIVGARPKVGKTVWCDNTGLHVAGTLGIPVLNLDTEMSDEEHWARILGHLTGIPMERIERGDLAAAERAALREKAAWLKTIPYYYRSVIDETFEEQVAAMRRWAVKTVGVDAQGVRNPCLVIYDYLQLTDPGEFSGNNFKEYQLLGFQMVALSRLAKKYDVPILSMLQLNRDGIDKETTAVAAGSDRIIWKCSNFSILKRKEPEEIQADGAAEGNLKLITLIARHGGGGEPGDYINVRFTGETAHMEEGRTRREIDKGRRPSNRKGFDLDEDEADRILDAA